MKRQIKKYNKTVLNSIKSCCGEESSVLDLVVLTPVKKSYIKFKNLVFLIHLQKQNHSFLNTIFLDF